MTILLIRHGETELNATRVVQFPDTPLGNNGVSQASRLGARLASRTIERVLSSDYRRAQSTAEQIALATDAELVISNLLRERHFGELRGLSYEEFEGLDIFAREYHPPGGESWDEFDARVDKAWQEILRHAQEVDADLAVVTHGLVLRSLLERHVDLNGHQTGDELVVANTSVTEVTSNSPWRVTNFACVRHLTELAGSGGPV
ncbi:MAG: histidine phosphatase family protein [Pseudomonadota bacterium]